MNNSSNFSVVQVNNLPVIVGSVVMLIAGIAAFIGNGLIIAVVLRYKSMRKKTDAIHLILYLAVSDLICGLSGIVATSDRFRLIITLASFNRGTCLAAAGLLIFTFTSSQFMIGFVAVDRLRAVMDPMGYRSKDHAKFAKRCFIVSLASGTFNTALTFGGDLSVVPPFCNGGASYTRFFKVYWLMFSYLISIAVVGLYAAVLILMVKKLKAAGGGKSAMAVQLKHQAKVTKTITYILLVYFFLWVVPATVFNTGAILGMRPEIMGLLGPMCATLAVFSAAVNIFIYSAKMPEFKKYFHRFIKGENDNAVATSVAVSEARSGAARSKAVLRRASAPVQSTRHR